MDNAFLDDGLFTKHQDSTSVCPDSAASKKRKPQKMGTIKPGHMNNH